MESADGNSFLVTEQLERECSGFMLFDDLPLSLLFLWDSFMVRPREAPNCFLKKAECHFKSSIFGAFGLDGWVLKSRMLSDMAPGKRVMTQISEPCKGLIQEKQVYNQTLSGNFKKTTQVLEEESSLLSAGTGLSSLTSTVKAGCRQRLSRA